MKLKFCLAETGTDPWEKGRSSLVELKSVFPPAQVLAEARRLGFHSVRGNHDDEALAAYEALARGHRVPSKRDWVRDMPPAAAQWLRQLPFSIRVPSYGLTVLHAGIVPDVRLFAPDSRAMPARLEI